MLTKFLFTAIISACTVQPNSYQLQIEATLKQVTGSMSELYAHIDKMEDLALIDAYRARVRELLDALIQIESSGNDKAVGDKGKALGALQIHKVYWQDAVERFQVLRDHDYEFVLNREYAERITVAYWMRYASQALADRDFETLARMHNGGVTGPKKKATLRYWKRVDAWLKKN